MPKDYTPYNAPTGRADAPQSGFGDVREQFTATGEMVVSTLRYALHARTRELDAALAKIAILEYTVKVYETHPLIAAYERLTASGASLVFVGEIVRGETPRIREAGDLLYVLEALASRWALFETRVIALSAEEAA